MTWSCTIPGEPVAMGRPRFSGGKFPRAYLPKKTRDWVRGATIILRSQWGAAPLEGAVAVELVFVHSRPKRLCRKKDAHGRLWRDRRPDIDNLCKSALDAIQAAGIVADDGQVAVLEGRDMYGAKGESGKVEISVWRLGEMG